MLVVPGTQTQYCPHQSHDGNWSGGKRPPTRQFWPLGYRSFEAAAAEYNGSPKAVSEPSALPILDITLEV